MFEFLIDFYNDKSAVVTAIIAVVGFFLIKRNKQKEMGISILSDRYKNLLDNVVELMLKTNDLRDTILLKKYMSSSEGSNLFLNFRVTYYIGGARFVEWHNNHMSKTGLNINMISIHELIFVLKQEFGMTSWWVNLKSFLFKKYFKKHLLLLIEESLQGKLPTNVDPSPNGQ